MTIPNQSYPELGNLVSIVPEIFSKSEIIGVLDGVEICASILHNANKLERIRFYENFSFTDDNDVKQRFQDRYNSWQKMIPNLKVLIKDGREFDTDSTFIYHDMNMPTKTFIDEYGSSVKSSLLANCGFGNNANMKTTLHMAKLIYERIIFPVLVYRDILFYTIDENKQIEYYNIILKALQQSEFYYIEEKLDTSSNVIKLVLGIPYNVRVKNLINESE